MSASTFTEHYELGVYQGPDYVSFLGTYNDAMRKIDNGMFQNQQNGNATASDLDTVKGQVATVQANITAVNQQLEGYNIPALKTDVESNKTEIDSVDSRVESIENELQSADLSTIGTRLSNIDNVLNNQLNWNGDMVGTALTFGITGNANVNVNHIVENNGRLQGFAYVIKASVTSASELIGFTIRGTSVKAFLVGTLNTTINGVMGFAYVSSGQNSSQMYPGASPIIVNNGNVYLICSETNPSSFFYSRFTLYFA